MLRTTLILPHPGLSDFIYNYNICQSESAYINISFPWYANHDTSICFFLGDTPVQIKNADVKHAGESTSKVCLFGLMTHCKGTMKFEGNYNTFIIEFKPNGFNRMFGIPASEICDNTLPADEVIENGIEQLYEQLLNASGVPEMVSFADRFLLGVINKKKAVYVNDAITRIFCQLSSNINTANVSEYAYMANMSIRNFERRFLEQVGTSPKFFCKLLRFNAALKLKMVHPEKNWTDIAYDCGYFDSIHMIKEFKQFANASPTRLLNNYPGFTEETFTTIERTAL